MEAGIDTVLVGCPTYKGLAYALDEYLAAYAALKWPNRKLMLVDNTNDDGEYARSIRDRVEAVGGEVKHVVPSKDWSDTFYRSWKVLLTHAAWNGYAWVLSLEQDVIVPDMTLDTMLNAAGYIGAPFVTHTYPFHGNRAGFYQGLGCTLIKTELLTVALDERYEIMPSVEGAIYDCAKRVSHISLHGLLPIRHLDGEGRYWEFDRTNTNDEVSVGIE